MAEGDISKTVRTARGERITFRPMRTADLAPVERLCASEHFEVGAHNLRLLVATAPRLWEIAVNENGEVVAMNSCNTAIKLDRAVARRKGLSEATIAGLAGLAWGYQIIVRSDYRGERISSQFSWDALTTFMGSATGDSILRYRFHMWMEKKLSCYALMAPAMVRPLLRRYSDDSITVAPVTADNFAAVNAYDSGVHALDRTEFNRRWLLDDTLSDGRMRIARSLCAVDKASGAIVGYGTLRAITYYYGVEPMYADNEKIAAALLVSLAALLGRDEQLWVPMLARHRVMHEICTGHWRMRLTEFEHRQCSQPAMAYARHAVDMHRVYCPHEFWPV